MSFESPIPSPLPEQPKSSEEHLSKSNEGRSHEQGMLHPLKMLRVDDPKNVGREIESGPVWVTFEYEPVDGPHSENQVAAGVGNPEIKCFGQMELVHNANPDGVTTEKTYVFAGRLPGGQYQVSDTEQLAYQGQIKARYTVDLAGDVTDMELEVETEPIGN